MRICRPLKFTHTFLSLGLRKHTNKRTQERNTFLNPRVKDHTLVFRALAWASVKDLCFVVFYSDQARLLLFTIISLPKLATPEAPWE